MARVELNIPFKKIRGKLNKKEPVVLRRKEYKAPNGAVLTVGPEEAYVVANPRDFEKNPPKGDELANMQSFGSFSLLASELIRSAKLTDSELAAMTPEDRAKTLALRAELERLRERFYAQFKRPDPEAPFEKKPEPGSMVRRRRQYVKLDTFIQAILRERSKKSTQNA